MLENVSIKQTNKNLSKENEIHTLKRHLHLHAYKCHLSSVLYSNLNRMETVFLREISQVWKDKHHTCTHTHIYGK